MIITPVLIIGASVSGLAVAASLQHRGIGYVIIEKDNSVAAPWRRHYDRLHLHTNKSLSNLPYKKFSSAVARYPSRQQVIDYLEDYQKTFEISPVFNTTALSVEQVNHQWFTKSSNGIFSSSFIVMATGAFEKPRVFNAIGVQSFNGQIMHSAAYKTGKPFAGQDVLVVGFGNSACEIALDLLEQGARPSMSVRSPVNVLPRDILGIPILRVSLLMRFLPAQLADTLNAPLLRLLTGNISRLGLQKMAYGPLQQIARDRKAPVLDIGTLSHIRKGAIKIYPGIECITGRQVQFTDGRTAGFNAIVAAIGYDSDCASIVKTDPARFLDLQRSINAQQYFGTDGLYFCGFWISPTGQFREIAMDAKKIAKDIAFKKNEMAK